MIIDAARVKRTHDDLTYIGAILWLDADGQPSIFAIGLLKISVFKDLTSAMTERLFGEFGHKMIADIPKILMIYWIMIITFNLVPYIALQILLSTN